MLVGKKKLRLVVGASVAAGALLVGGGAAMAVNGPASESAPVTKTAPKSTTSTDGASARGAKWYKSTDTVRSHEKAKLSGTVRGKLHSGSNYYKCWTRGGLVEGNGRSSYIWMLTDDDSGNKDVWVTDIYLDSYGYKYNIKQLPEC